MLQTRRRIGLLATGSELTSGEILNTNGQIIAQKLQSLGMDIGEHLIVDDTQSNIEAALNFMLSRHDALIITGGLGPTSDDLTRFALSTVTGQALKFSEASWQRIVDRLSKRNIPIPDNNRQQALFPESAEIYPNLNGTADACYLNHHNKPLFMLPGPPRECLPIFNEQVLSKLLSLGFGTHKRLHRWRLMGISESAIAEQLEELGKPYQLQFAYRAAYPYIDIKLMLEKNANYQAIVNAVGQLLKPYLVTTENLPISVITKQALNAFSNKISVCDLATKGALSSKLICPENQHAIQAVSNPSQEYCVIINGLQEYWQPQADAFKTRLDVTLQHQGQQQHFHCDIYLRGQETLDYAVEFVAHKLYLRWLNPTTP